MPIYDRPTKSLMADWAKETLKPDQAFSRSDAIQWFAEHYPKIKRNTVAMHVDGMSVNNRIRRHHPSIKPNSGFDLFYKLGPDQFRLWNDSFRTLTDLLALRRIAAVTAKLKLLDGPPHTL